MFIAEIELLPCIWRKDVSIIISNSLAQNKHLLITINKYSFFKHNFYTTIKIFPIITINSIINNIKI